MIAPLREKALRALAARGLMQSMNLFPHHKGWSRLIETMIRWENWKQAPAGERVYRLVRSWAKAIGEGRLL